MSTESFYQQVVVRDPEKIKEIQEALRSDKHAYADLPPTHMDRDAEEKFVKEWCALLKKEKSEE